MNLSKRETIYDEEKELKFFLNGHKPAIIPKNKSSIIYKNLSKKNYMYCYSGWVGMPMYFQNLHIAARYMSSLAVGADVNILNGITLGYPLDSVLRFSKLLSNDEMEEGITYINYHGLYFATFQDLVPDNLKWLDEFYKMPKKDNEILVQTINPYQIIKY
jgi:hypothetical protein